MGPIFAAASHGLLTGEEEAKRSRNAPFVGQASRNSPSLPRAGAEASSRLTSQTKKRSRRARRPAPPASASLFSARRSQHRATATKEIERKELRACEASLRARGLCSVGLLVSVASCIGRPAHSSLDPAQKWRLKPATAFLPFARAKICPARPARSPRPQQPLLPKAALRTGGGSLRRLLHVPQSDLKGQHRSKRKLPRPSASWSAARSRTARLTSAGALPFSPQPGSGCVACVGKRPGRGEGVFRGGIPQGRGWISRGEAGTRLRLSSRFAFSA